MSVSLKQSIVPTFGRHETFTLRYSWLKRGYDAIAEPDFFANRSAISSDYYVFADPDAHHVLGVGKNMARSIRFWLQAARVIEEVRVEGSRQSMGLPSIFGQALLDDSAGLDPFLEHEGTWWLIHWMMISPGSHLPVWWSAFHTFAAVNFTTDELYEHTRAQVDATSAWQRPKRPSESTIKRDVLALLRNYAGAAGSRKREMVDDELDSPFVPLTLIRSAEERGAFRFGVGPKPGLPPAIAAFACLDFLSRTGSTARQVLIATLATEQGGPGRAFRLTERDLTELLEKAASDHSDLLQMTSTAGADGVAVLGGSAMGTVAATILWRHYAALGSDAAEPRGPYLPWSSETEQAEQEHLLRPESQGWT